MIKAKIKRGSGLVVKVKLRGYPPNVAVEFTGIVSYLCKKIEPGMRDGCKPQDFMRELFDAGIARYERSLTEDGHG